MGIVPQNPCSICGKVKPLTDFSERRAQCKECRAVQRQQRNRANLKTKKATLCPCADCDNLFPYGELMRRTRRCAGCAKANELRVEQAYKQRTEIKVREAQWMRAKRAADPDKAREQARESMQRWRQKPENAQKAREQAKDWRDKNPEQYKARYLEWRRSEQGKAVRNMHNQNREARKHGNGGEITAQEWQNLKAYYDYHCLCCGKQEPQIVLTLDHVIPISQGGPNTIENSQPLCKSCNSRKKTKTIDYRPSWS
jgi:5-methylcytosine-specific restriction endonuclease McrA